MEERARGSVIGRLTASLLYDPPRPAGSRAADPAAHDPGPAAAKPRSARTSLATIARLVSQVPRLLLTATGCLSLPGRRWWTADLIEPRGWSSWPWPARRNAAFPAGPRRAHLLQDGKIISPMEADAGPGRCRRGSILRPPWAPPPTMRAMPSAPPFGMLDAAGGSPVRRWTPPVELLCGDSRYGRFQTAAAAASPRHQLSAGIRCWRRSRSAFSNCSTAGPFWARTRPSPATADQFARVQVSQAMGPADPRRRRNDACATWPRS